MPKESLEPGPVTQIGPAKAGPISERGVDNGGRGAGADPRQKHLGSGAHRVVHGHPAHNAAGTQADAAVHVGAAGHA